MKGGVGKTTISANIFRLMFRRNHLKTLLVDMDPQYNLTQMLMEPDDYADFRNQHKTVLTAMEPPPSQSYLNIRTTAQPPPEPQTLTYEYRFLRDSADVKLELLPGSFGLIKYSLATDAGKLRKVEARYQHFMELCQASYDLVGLDCNPSSSFLTQCALKVCTHLLVPVREDAYSKLGLQLLSDFVSQLPRAKPPKMIILINQASRDRGPSAVERDIRSDKIFGPLTLASRIYKSGYLVAKPNYIGDALDKTGSYHDRLISDLNAVADEIASLLKVR